MFIHQIQNLIKIVNKNYSQFQLLLIITFNIMEYSLADLFFTVYKLFDIDTYMPVLFPFVKKTINP